ncbi:hypothetical protein SNE40_022742 [Patella caerulea]|uniref:Poly [ADP-ribose] polymerase n=1 Tax=Patella caerulea TaxID=87958 RepID=A0AAN8G8T9_PATCE
MDLEEYSSLESDSSPPAFRVERYTPPLDEEEEPFLQAALINEVNEDKYQTELDQALALSLLESEGTNDSLKLNELLTNETLEIGGSNDLQARGSSAHQAETPNSLSSIHLENSDSDSGTATTDEDREYSRELKELIRHGIISPSEISEKFRRIMGSEYTQNDSDTNIDTVDANAQLESSDSRIRGIEELEPVPFTSDNILQNWSKEDINDRGSVYTYKLFPIYPGCREYDAILHDFTQSGLIIEQVERLQNVHLLEKYKSEQDHLLKARQHIQGFDLNVRYLYHGTPADKERISEEGLDARLSRMGCFGKGIYFSDNPRKCIQYTGVNKKSECILMCRVILGDAKVYPPRAKDVDLRREPEKEIVTGGWRFYDSVKGCPIDYNEFVVYENRRAMIEYIITYRTDPNATMKGPTALQSSLAQGGQPAAMSNITEEEHMRTIELVRDSVRKQRCIEKGEVWVEPSEVEREKERRKWRNIMSLSDTGGRPMPYKKGSGTSNSSGAVGGTSGNAQLDLEDAAVNEVMNVLITDFTQVTQIADIEKARQIILDADMQLEVAVERYYSTLGI